MVDSNKIVIQLNKKSLTLQIKDFADSNINTEELLQIDYSNIIGDIITFPVLFNRIANIKAEIDSFLREVQLDMKIFEAQLYEKHKKEFVTRGEKATETAIDMAIQRDPQYKIKKIEVFKVEKQSAIIDGLYWAAKSKTKMLEAISMKIKPEEFEKEILEGTINDVIIKVYNNSFVNKR